VWERIRAPTAVATVADTLPCFICPPSFLGFPFTDFAVTICMCRPPTPVLTGPIESAVESDTRLVACAGHACRRMWNAVVRPFSFQVRHDGFEQQPPSPGDSNSLRPLVCPKLCEYRPDMRLDCSVRDCHAAADLLGTEPQHEVTQNRELTIRKRLIARTLGDSRSPNGRKRP